MYCAVFIRCTTELTRCHSLPVVVTRCHSLSIFVIRCTTRCYLLSLVVMCCHSLHHSLSLFVIVCHSLCHSLSLVVILCHSMYTFYKRSTVIARLPRTTQPIFPRLLYFAVISVTSRLVKQFMKNPENIDHIALGTVEWINCSIMKDGTIVFLTFCFSFLSDKR